MTGDFFFLPTENEYGGFSFIPTFKGGEMHNKGVSAMELIIVIAVIGILFVGLGVSYQNWMGKYRVEKAVKELYSDLMHARVLAMEKNRKHYAVLNSDSYSIMEDTNDDDVANAGDATLKPFPKKIEYGLNWNNSGNKIYFDKRGLLTPNRTLRFTSTSDPDYDCMKISRTRILMGHYLNGECVAER